MAVGSSVGAYYDDEFHQAAAQWDDKYDDNIVTPNQADTNKQLNQVEQTELGGTPVANKTYDTTLTPEQEAVYGSRYGADANQDYDMRGYFAANPDATPNAEGQHYPDTFKKPNHPTFSDESIYNGVDGNQGGKWGREGDSDTFTPGPTNMQNWGRHGLEDYFNRVEPGVKLNLPPQSSLPVTQVDFKPITTKTGVTITQEDIDKGISVAMAAGPGTIAGVRSMTMDSAKYYKAAGMEGRKVPEEEIQQATGWWKGKSDGKSRYEISDDKMKLVDRDWMHGETGKLSEFVDHPELFKAYPELKDINFKVAGKGDPYLGSFNSHTNTLTINPSKIRAGDEGLLDVISHELQHAVQRTEGFSPGSSPDTALKDALIAASKISDHKEAWSIIGDISRKAKEFGEYMYQRTPGEVEANNVMARRKLTPEQRKSFSPQDTVNLLEGSENSLSGGKYFQEFNYP